MKLFRSFGVISHGTGFQRRIYLIDHEEKQYSAWHKVAMFKHHQKHVLPAVIEISRHNIAKLEMCLDETNNPLKQDTRTNPTTGEPELRFYARFPLFNYGFFPQTWENPFENDPKQPYKGDGDPIDLVEIGMHALPSGTLLDVKVLGVICLIDQGEVDWKVIGINYNDRNAKKVHNPFDIEKVYPGKLKAIQQWFEEIKTYDGKPRNKVLGSVEGPEEAMEVIRHGHEQWNRLQQGEYKEAGYWISKAA